MSEMGRIDRELLELAAFAAGYCEIDGWSIETHKGMRWVSDDRGFLRYWNPLSDDGDALRLAVACGFINPGQWPCAGYIESDRMLVETGTIDWYAATRRAIVIAAADIGKKISNKIR